MMKNDFTNGCNVKADVPNDQKGRHYDVFEEVVVISSYLRKQGILSKISEQVRFTRKRFGRYEVSDFLAVQIALRDQWRAYSGNILREPPAPCGSIHGLVRTRPITFPLGSLAFFSSLDGETGRGPAHTLSR